MKENEPERKTPIITKTQEVKYSTTENTDKDKTQINDDREKEIRNKELTKQQKHKK